MHHWWLLFSHDGRHGNKAGRGGRISSSFGIIDYLLSIMGNIWDWRGINQWVDRESDYDDSFLITQEEKKRLMD